MTTIDLTNDDWIREGRNKAEDLRLEYNQLAERHGWKTIPKGKAPPLPRLAQQLKDLKDCIEAGIVLPLPQPDDPKSNWDGVARRAPSLNEE